VAALVALFACLPLIHFFMGIGMLLGWMEPSQSSSEGFPLLMMGWFMVLFAGFFIAAGWGLAICTAMAGKYLAEHKRYNFCLVVAAVLCLFMPFGTVLGVFTILVLVRPSVKALFEGRAMPSSPAPVTTQPMP
jgi:hypothetical protein